MIEQITEGVALGALSYKNVFEGKVKVNFEAYGLSHDFCRFYRQGDKLVMSCLDNSFVIAVIDDDDYDVAELAAFLKAHNANGTFLPPKLVRQMNGFFHEEIRYNHLMKYVDKTDYAYPLDDSPKLDDAYRVASTGFQIDYSSWLTDLSHRVRHGISKTYLYKNSATGTVLYDRDNTVFITQVATLPEARGKGLATEMVRAIASIYAKDSKDVLLVCRQMMKGFYERVGFTEVGEVCQTFRKAPVIATSTSLVGDLQSPTNGC